MLYTHPEQQGATVGSPLTRTRYVREAWTMALTTL